MALGSNKDGSNFYDFVKQYDLAALQSMSATTSPLADDPSLFECQKFLDKIKHLNVKGKFN